MILQCPHCQSRFLLPDHALGAAGRQVRCGKCKHQWFQEPEAPRAQESFAPLRNDELIREPAPHFEEISPRDHLEGVLPPPDAETVAEWQRVYDERRVPALRPRQGAPRGLIFAAELSAVVASLLALAVVSPWLATHVPASQPALSLLGMAPSDGLLLADLSYRAKPAGQRTRHFVGCVLRNVGAHAQAVPDLRLRMVNAKGEVLYSGNHLLAPMPSIAPGDEVPCDIPAPALRTGSSTHLVLDMGSPLAIARRANWVPSPAP